MFDKNDNFYDFSLDPPYNMDHSFKNLENPISFIQNQKIKVLKHNYENLKSEFKNGQDEKTKLSTTIYKKIISHDNQYNFQHSIVGYELDPAVKFNHKYSNSQHRQLQQNQEKRQLKSLERKYKHGSIVTIEEKRQRLRQLQQIPLSFKHVRLIDSPQFEDMKQVQFYHLIKESQELSNQMSTNIEIKNLNVLAQLKLFQHKFEDQSNYYSQSSYDVFFNCQRELNFWKFDNSKQHNQILTKQEQMLSNCALIDPQNITIFDMFDFASKNIEVNDLAKFYALKKQLKSKMEMEKNNESLEGKYNEAKKRFEQMKENRLKSKNQRLPLKFASTVAQTNEEMKEKDFEDYFVQNAKDIFDRLKQLNEIREVIILRQDKEDFHVMATNIGVQISNELFKLLLVVLKGQNLSNYSQFVQALSPQDVERKILELIYLQFANFKQIQVNGYKKIDIIKAYLEERQKNQRFYEAYLAKCAEKEPQSTITPKKSVKPKVPVKTDKKKK